ncbi:MAG: hypothetical protein ACTSRZ_20735 [Promethearchaeota archaeon]
MTAKFDSFYEFNMIHDIFAHSESYKDFFIRLMFCNKHIEKILEHTEKKKVFYKRFKLLTHEQTFVFPEERGTEKLKSSEPKRRMDTGLLLDNIPIAVIEVEVFLSRQEQITQLRDYFKLIVNILHEFAEKNNAHIKYFQYLRMISFSLQLSERYHSIFEFTKGEALPLIIFEISKQWRKLPPESISYMAFKFIEDHKDIKNLEELRNLINQYLNRIEDQWQKFYFAGILKLYGDDCMDAVIREKESAGEVPKEEDVVKSMSDEWVRFLKPEQIKHLGPEQIKHLGPGQIKHLGSGQIKHLGPEQIKHLGPEQIKHLEPEQIKHLGPEQIKHLEPEQINCLTIEQLKNLDTDKILNLLLALKEKDRKKILDKFNQLQNNVRK